LVLVIGNLQTIRRHIRPTWGLAILGLDVVSFNILSLSAFVPAGRSLLSFGS